MDRGWEREKQVVSGQVGLEGKGVEGGVAVGLRRAQGAVAQGGGVRWTGRGLKDTHAAPPARPMHANAAPGRSLSMPRWAKTLPLITIGLGCTIPSSRVIPFLSPIPHPISYTPSYPPASAPHARYAPRAVGG